MELLVPGSDDIHSLVVKHGAEVISCAGTIKTPQLLELSGIGDPTRLNALGIETVVDLPGVGEGIVDQVFFGVSYGALVILRRSRPSNEFPQNWPTTR